MKIPTQKKMAAELHRQDPESAISQSYVRDLAIGGYVPNHRHGNRYLIDFDALLRFEGSRTGQCDGKN